MRGGPRSPSPHLTPPPTHAPNLLFLMLLPQSFTTTKLKKKKNQTMLGLGSCWAPSRAPRPPQDSPGPAPRPCSPQRRSYRPTTAIAVRAG